jgi:hypothetical protein
MAFAQGRLEESINKGMKKRDVFNVGGQGCCYNCGTTIVLLPPSKEDRSCDGMSQKKEQATSATDKVKGKEGKEENKEERPLLLSAECFVVSRGWQIDERRLLRYLDRIVTVARFDRLQFATTISLVAENAAPRVDILVVHVGGHDLADAAHSVNKSESNVATVAGSVASVAARQLVRIAAQNQTGAILASLPLPLSNASDKFLHLRKAFSARLEANCSGWENVHFCDHGNLASSEEAISKHFTPAGQLTSQGIKRMVKNWDKRLKEIFAKK